MKSELTDLIKLFKMLKDSYGNKYEEFIEKFKVENSEMVNGLMMLTNKLFINLSKERRQEILELYKKERDPNMFDRLGFEIAEALEVFDLLYLPLPEELNPETWHIPYTRKLEDDK